MDWGKFKLLVENKTNFKIRLKSTDEIDEAVNLFMKSIQEPVLSSSTFIPYINHTRNVLLHIIILIAEKCRAYAIWKSTKYPSGKCEFNNLANKLRNISCLNQVY